ncbi:MAG: hypothetical protein IJ087_00745 [Eggerthellaceae bacterium]|nr:hypothetical protein [Eggerthellaceae bacterium]MBR1828754.1 hypothetical protein [Atopobiaceae bacterium]
MTTDAQKRANRKYQKEKTKQIAIRFSPNEMDVYDFIKSRPEGIAPYLKRLVREDMERRG